MMSSKQKPGRGSEQFVVRLPDGMRDRIKAAAARNQVSMNELVVEILNRHFPAPWSLSDRIDELLDIVYSLKEGVDVDAVQHLTAKILETLREVADKKIPIDDKESLLAIQELLGDLEGSILDEVEEVPIPDYAAGDLLEKKQRGYPLALYAILCNDPENLEHLIEALKKDDRETAAEVIKKISVNTALGV
ncbi:plasmid stability protein [Labrenzia sp. EL_142]|nr:plasmid stability protein [Labrenzia sp. EL_142]